MSPICSKSTKAAYFWLQPLQGCPEDGLPPSGIPASHLPPPFPHPLLRPHWLAFLRFSQKSDYWFLLLPVLLRCYSFLRKAFSGTPVRTAATLLSTSLQGFSLQRMSPLTDCTVTLIAVLCLPTNVCGPMDQVLCFVQAKCPSQTCLAHNRHLINIPWASEETQMHPSQFRKQGVLFYPPQQARLSFLLLHIMF